MLRFKIACLASARFDLVAELAAFGIDVDPVPHYLALVEAHTHLWCHWKIKSRNGPERWAHPQDLRQPGI